MDKFETKLIASSWQYAARPCFKIIVPLATLVSLALLYNFEWHIENGYYYANWKTTTVLKSSPKIANYKGGSTLETFSTIGS